MLVENEREKKISFEFHLWLAQWRDINWEKNLDIYFKLFNVYKFVNYYIKFEYFLDKHGWKIDAWKEVDILVRDVELTDKLLLRLPAKIRINLLAAIQNYTQKELARYVHCSSGQMSNIFNFEKKSEEAEYFLLPLARFLDAPYWSIQLDTYDVDPQTRTYDEYNHVKTISLLEMISEINIEPDSIKFLRIKKSQEYFIRGRFIYVKVIAFSKFKVIEAMELNYETDEIFDFINYGIRDQVRCIIVTPALLRRTKKVIYVLKSLNEKDSEKEMNSYISKMKKRKFTRIIE
jgi:transcriptional regulator with XRE-family HTH domain